MLGQPPLQDQSWLPRRDLKMLGAHSCVWTPAVELRGLNDSGGPARAGGLITSCCPRRGLIKVQPRQEEAGVPAASVEMLRQTRAPPS